MPEEKEEVERYQGFRGKFRLFGDRFNCTNEELIEAYEHNKRMSPKPSFFKRLVAHFSVSDNDIKNKIMDASKKFAEKLSEQIVHQHKLKDTFEKYFNDVILKLKKPSDKQYFKRICDCLASLDTGKVECADGKKREATDNDYKYLLLNGVFNHKVFFNSICDKVREIFPQRLPSEWFSK